MDVQSNFQTPKAFRFYKKFLKVSFFCFLFMLLRFTFLEPDWVIQICYLAMTLVSLLGIWMVKKPKLMAYAVFVTTISLVLCFVVAWVRSGGVYSSYSTAYYSIMMILVAVMPRRFKQPSLIIFCLISLVLSAFFNYELAVDEVTGIWMQMDYLMNSVIVAICMIYVKDDLEAERQTYDQYNVQLDRVTQQLFEKRKQLLTQRNEIQNTRNNLEKIIEKKTQELTQKNKLLASYAYNNAHILRAPLSNILGLISILERENIESEKTKGILQQLKTQAVALDELVKEVNHILH